MLIKERAETVDLIRIVERDCARIEIVDVIKIVERDCQLTVKVKLESALFSDLF